MTPSLTNLFFSFLGAGLLRFVSPFHNTMGRSSRGKFLGRKESIHFGKAFRFFLFSTGFWERVSVIWHFLGYGVWRGGLCLLSMYNDELMEWNDFMAYCCFGSFG